jgi:hypothetical protein
MVVERVVFEHVPVEDHLSTGTEVSAEVGG